MPNLEEIPIKGINIPQKRLYSKHQGIRAISFEESFKGDGQLEPITVFKDREGKLWLGDGFHRLREAEKFHHETLLAIVREGSEEDAVMFSVKSNVHRGKLDPANLAKTLCYFHVDKGLTMATIAQEFHLSRGYVDKLVQIAQGDPRILKALQMGEMTTPEAYRAIKIGMLNPQEVRKKCHFCDDYITPEKLKWRPYHAECALKVDMLIRKDQMKQPA